MRFFEKPQEGVTTSRLASVVFYCLRKESLLYISEFLIQNPDANDRTFGKFWVSVELIFELKNVNHQDFVLCDLRCLMVVGMAYK